MKVIIEEEIVFTLTPKKIVHNDFDLRERIFSSNNIMLLMLFLLIIVAFYTDFPT